MMKDLKIANEKICPACQAVFQCMGEEDCWCEQYRIHKKEMVRLMHDFNDCLCPQCLKTYESKL